MKHSYSITFLEHFFFYINVVSFPISTKKKRALKGTTVIGTPKKSGGRQLQIRGLTKQGKRSADKLTAKGLERVKKQVAKDAARETAKKATQSVAVKQASKQVACLDLHARARMRELA